MRASTQFILILLAVKLFDSWLPLSANAAEHASAPSCSVVLLDLASLKTQIENETDPTMASALKRAYQTKLKEARTRQIDLTKLNEYMINTREDRRQQGERNSERRSTTDTTENKIFNFPHAPVQLPEGFYAASILRFWNRYAVTIAPEDGPSPTLVLDLQTGKIIRVIRGRFFFNGISISADGKWALLPSVDPDQPTVLYDLVHGKEVFEINVPGRTEFSPDGTKVLLSGDENPEVWDLSKGKPEKFFETKTNAETHFSADGSRLVAYPWIPRFDADRKVDVWDIATGLPARKIPLIDGTGGYALSGDGHYVAIRYHAYAKDKQNTVEIFDLTNGKLIQVLKVSYNFKFSADSKSLIASSEKKFSYWDIKTGAQKLEINMAESAGSHVVVANHLFAIITKTGYMVYDTNTGALLSHDTSGKKATIEFVIINGHTHLVAISNTGLVTAEKFE